MPRTDVIELPATRAPRQTIHPEVSPAADVGRSAPVGATFRDGGVNFSLYSRDAASVQLVFFDREDDPQASRVITLDPSINRTYHYWHVFVPGIQAGQLYGYRIYGAFDPGKGMRFDVAK